jgi:Ca2+-binding RTX toxin-like protein
VIRLVADDATVVALYNSGRELGLVPAPLKDGSLLLRRTLLVLATTMSFAVLGIGGVAYAAVIQCEAGVLDCIGTDQPDTITGTKGPDRIRGLEGGDTIDARGGQDLLDGGEGNNILHGRSGPDGLFGEGGDDTLFGESRGDTFQGAGGSNEYFGASGADDILANQSRTGETETVSAGPGNDTINADDTFFFEAERDNIDCGSGKDIVSADSADDIAANCEDVR